MDLGIHVGGAQGRKVTHKIWADGIWMFARTKIMLQVMVGEVTAQLWIQFKMIWKPTDLFVMHAGVDDATDFVFVDPTFLFLPPAPESLQVSSIAFNSFWFASLTTN